MANTAKATLTRLSRLLGELGGQGANFGLDIARGVGALLLELERQGDAAGKRSLVVFGNLIRWIVVLWNCAYGHINSLSQKLPPRLEKAVTWDSQRTKLGHFMEFGA